MNEKPKLAALALLPLVVACGSGKDFESSPPFADTDDARVWLTSSSALSVYTHAYEPIGVADGALAFADPVCPKTSDDGTTLSIQGGCTDANGKEWSGGAKVVRNGDERILSLYFLDGMLGTVHVRAVGSTATEFDAEILVGGVTTIDYQGTIDGDYEGRTVFNGSGRIERDGYLPPNGVVQATTENEVVDDALCSGQPVSGSTTVTARGDSATVTYDGETDCDDAKNARFSVNGDDRGMISGINCALSGVGTRARSGSEWAGFFALSLLIARARRRRTGS